LSLFAIQHCKKNADIHKTHYSCYSTKILFRSHLQTHTETMIDVDLIINDRLKHQNTPNKTVLFKTHTHTKSAM